MILVIRVSPSCLNTRRSAIGILASQLVLLLWLFAQLTVAHPAVEDVHSKKGLSQGFAAIEKQHQTKAWYQQYLLNPALQWDDVYFCLYVTLTLIVLRFITAGAFHPKLRRLPSLFNYLALYVGKEKKGAKFAENLWYSCWHTLSFCFGTYVLYQESMTSEAPGWTRLLFSKGEVIWYWFPTPAEVALQNNAGWPAFPMSPMMKTYYLISLSYWMSCAAFLWIETLRKDFPVLLLHHVSTCVLILFSYCCSLWRIGAVIQLTHDLADVLLYIAKTAAYSKAPSLVVDVFFLFFVVGFFLTRLVFFPFFCVRTVLDASHWRVWSKSVFASHWDVPGAVSMPIFLCVLQLLHIFWFGLIVKMIRKTIRNSTVTKEGDIRSEDESSDTEQGDKRNKAD